MVVSEIQSRADKYPPESLDRSASQFVQAATKLPACQVVHPMDGIARIELESRRDASPAGNPLGVPRDRGRNLPAPGHSVHAPGDESLSVGTDGKGKDFARVHERRADRKSGCSVPDPHGAIA